MFVCLQQFSKLSFNLFTLNYQHTNVLCIESFSTDWQSLSSSFRVPSRIYLSWVLLTGSLAKHSQGDCKLASTTVCIEPFSTDWQPSRTSLRIHSLAKTLTSSTRSQTCVDDHSDVVCIEPFSTEQIDNTSGQYLSTNPPDGYVLNKYQIHSPNHR